jgi:sialic acid synthase SpsE
MINFFRGLHQCYLIAEIGVNHNGDIDLACKMIDEAKKSGADAVKFQTFTADNLVSKKTPKVHYQENSTASDESHFEMIKKFELSESSHIYLAQYCEKLKIDFLSTPYDLNSAKFLNGLGVKMFKTASADLVDLPLHNYIASTGKPAIVATGMGSLGEIEQVVNIYREAGNPHLILLHCVSNYPCSDASLNLRAINTLAKAFNLPVGFSDHSIDKIAAIISLSFGAKVIEKHFTLDNSLPGPDHKASSLPCEFKDLVQSVRRAEIMLGSSRKACQSEERQMAEISRKSIFISKDLKSGKLIEISDLCLMRPGNGLYAQFIPQLVGQRIRYDLPAYHQISWSDIEKTI